MTQIEQLISEIEKKLRNYKTALENTSYMTGQYVGLQAKIALCEELLEAAKTILKEPASEDLEQATEKAIRWFEAIADECDKLTSGNVAHLKAQIKGMAIRSAEYLTKHSQESVSEDLEKASEEYAYTNWESDDYHEGASEGKPFDAIGHTQKCFIDGAEWQKEQMMKGAISGIIFGSRYFRQKNISLTNLSEEQYDKLKDFGERIKVIIIKE